MELRVLGVTDDDFERIFIAWIALQFSAGSNFFVFFDREFSNFQTKNFHSISQFFMRRSTKNYGAEIDKQQVKQHHSTLMVK
jgi:hypothetical protein